MEVRRGGTAGEAKRVRRLTPAAASAASLPSLPISFSTARIAAPAAGLMSALRLSCPGVFSTSSSDTCSRPARYAAALTHAAPSIVLAGRSARWPGLRPRVYKKCWYHTLLIQAISKLYSSVTMLRP